MGELSQRHLIQQAHVLLTFHVLCFTGITVLLSLTVFMLLVAEIMPATSDSVPLIGDLHSYGGDIMFTIKLSAKL